MRREQKEVQDVEGSGCSPVEFLKGLQGHPEEGLVPHVGGVEGWRGPGATGVVVTVALARAQGHRSSATTGSGGNSMFDIKKTLHVVRPVTLICLAHSGKPSL